MTPLALTRPSETAGSRIIGPEPRTLAGYRDLHKEATILVCGCGASLSTLRDPERFITIGVNDVGRLFDPTYLVVLNPRQQFSGDRFRHVEQSRAQALFTQLDLRIRHPNVVRFRLGAFAGFDTGDHGTLSYTRNSPYVAVALAVHMGARRIGLIGVDFSQDHFFAATGAHPLSCQLATIDKEYGRLHHDLARRGIEFVNLSEQSRLTSLPKMSTDAFTAGLELGRFGVKDAAGLRIVSYATTPVAGVPAILARCIAARTEHRARCVWARNGYGNGVAFEGDLEWSANPSAAEESLAEADVVILHNGKIEARHRRLIAGKAVVTMAHNYLWNVDPAFVRKGFPGVVVGQYQATLPEFASWALVPNPLPLWEAAFRPGDKPVVVTICYTPSGKHEQFPLGHRLYWHGKGYQTTMAVLDRLSRRYSLHLEVISNRQISHAAALAMKRRAHIVIDECVTGSYHRNSLEGLACGSVVVNGVQPGSAVSDVFLRCAGDSSDLPFPFVAADLEGLERVLAGLIETGPRALAEAGARNRAWAERHWDFARQWDVFWRPQVELARAQAPPELRNAQRLQAAKQPERPASVAMDPAKVSVIIPHGGSARTALLRATLQSLRRCSGVGQIIVSEFDATPVARELARDLADAYVFVGNRGAFHKARAINVALPLAEQELLLWLDNDLLLPVDFIDRAVAELRRRRLDCLVPWTSVGYLSAEDTVRVIEGRGPATTGRPMRSFWSREGACGGAVLVRAEFLHRFGGLCEEFRGWGGEDNAWFYKARLLGRAAITERSDQHLHHLYHARSGGYAGEEPSERNPDYTANVALLNEVRRLTTADRFLARFPPPVRASCPWPTTKRIAFVAPTSGEAAGILAQAANALADLYDITVSPNRGGPADVEVVCDGIPSSDEPIRLTLRQTGGVGLVSIAEELSISPADDRVDCRSIVRALIPPLSFLLADGVPEVRGAPAISVSLPYVMGALPQMKLNLGCCDAVLEGYVNVDILPGIGIEVVADLRQPWPWPDGSVDFVRAHDIIEHLPDKIFTMNELWRVLKPGAEAEIFVPTTDGPGAFQDPTHVSFWNRRSFLYYEAGNPYRERFVRSYGILAKFRVVRERTKLTQDGPKLTIVLAAVKP